MITRLLFLIFTLLCTISLLGQGPNSIVSPLDGPPKGKVKGKVIDEISESPLEFATISILTPQDSSIISGEITNLEGSFELDLDYGQYLIKVEFIGYRPNYKQIQVDESTSMLNLGAIVLQSDAQVLAEVEVRAEKSTLQMGLDKKVFNVGKDLANTSGTASEILDNIPSVTVDVEGNVSLRGSEGVRILVDGKPSGLVGVRGSDGLRSLAANMIERVEVITNPSARYEAEGMTGIINIVLKKDRKKGVNGSFDLTTGSPHNHGAAVNLNFRRKKFNVFTNYALRWRRSPGINDRFQRIEEDDVTRYVDQDGDRLRGGWTNSFRLGADYFLNDKNTLTTSFLYRYGLDNNNSTIVYRDYRNDFPDNLTRITVRTQDEEETEPNLEYALNYKRKFERKGHELTASVQYRESTEGESALYQENYFNPDFSPAGSDVLDQRSDNDEGETSLLVQIDYVQPFSKDGKFEFGYRGSLRGIENKYLVEEFADNAWMRLDSLSNDFNYDEDIHAAYAILGNKINRFSYQFGLRLEHSDVRTELLDTQEENDRSYTNLFPSAFLGYELGEGNSMQVSYSKRIRRPRFWDLNPFFTFSDARNIFRGNPNVDPEFTDSYEISYIKYWDKTSISSSVYYRHTQGVIQRIQRIEGQGEDLVTIRQPENLATENSYGLEFIISMEPTEWWRLNSNFNFFRSITDGTNLDQNFEATATSMSGRLNNRFTIWDKVDFQTNISYEAPRRNTQGKVKSRLGLDLAANRDILKGKGTLTLSVRDLLNTRAYRYILEGENFYSSNRWQRRPQQVILTFNYRLNQQKRKGRGGRGGGNYSGGGNY